MTLTQVPYIGSCCCIPYVDDKELLQVKEAAGRLCTLYNSKAPKIVAYIDYSRTKDSVTGEVFSRVLLEHVYKKRACQITLADTRNLCRQIHPDKRNYPVEESTALFQLHQNLLDTANLLQPLSYKYCRVWLHLTLYGWLYHRHIKRACQQELIA